MDLLINNWVLQIILPIGLSCLWFIGRQTSHQNSKIRLLDMLILLPFLLLSIHGLSVTSFGISFLPFIIFIFSVYGFFKVLLTAYYEGELMLKNFIREYLAYFVLFGSIIFLALSIWTLADKLGIL